MTDNNSVNQHIYFNILQDPDGLTARQNSLMLPSDRILYSHLLQILEYRDYRSFLAEDRFQKERLMLEHYRLLDSTQYFFAISAPEIRDAEEKRQKAKEFLNYAIMEGAMKSFLLDPIQNKEHLLTKNWWRQLSSFHIDGFSNLWNITPNEKVYTKGLIILERKNSERWFEGEPVPKGGSIFLETKCKQWLIDLMSADKRPTQSKSQYMQEAKIRFPTLGTKAFNRSWADALEFTKNSYFGQSGRPKKSRPGINTPE